MGKSLQWERFDTVHLCAHLHILCVVYEIPWERVPYLGTLEVWSRQGAIQIHVYLTFTLYLLLCIYLM